MNLKEIKKIIKEEESKVPPQSVVRYPTIYKDPSDAARRSAPLWSHTNDDKHEIPPSMARSARIADDLTNQLRNLPFHGFTDATLSERICCKCLKPVKRELGCCRLHAIWVCYACWDLMVKMAYALPKEVIKTSEPPLMRPLFERKVDGHLGAVED